MNEIEALVPRGGEIVAYVGWRGYDRVYNTFEPLVNIVDRTLVTKFQQESNDLIAQGLWSMRNEVAAALLKQRYVYGGLEVPVPAAAHGAVAHALLARFPRPPSRAGKAAGRRSASLMRSRRPCVLGCLRACLVSRTLAIPRWLRRVHAPGFSRCGSGSQDFLLDRSCTRRRDRCCRQCAARAVGRGEGAAARRSRRAQRPGLAAVGAWDGWAARRVRRATPASLAVVRSSVGRAPVWRPWRSMGPGR